MTKVSFFTYTVAQRNEISAVVRNAGLDVDQSLWSRIEIAANRHILHSAFESQTPGQKAHIKRLQKLRDKVEALPHDMVDALATSFTIKGDDGAGHRIMLDGRKQLDIARDTIAEVVGIFETRIAAQRPQPTANTSKKGRDRFWNEVVAIWIDIGGEATSGHARDFLTAVSKPVFVKVRADGGRKTAASMPLNRKSVGEWLRLRARRQRRPVS